MFAVASPITRETADVVRSWVKGHHRAVVSRRFIRVLNGGAYLFEARGDALACLLALKIRSEGGIEIYAGCPVNEWDLPQAARTAAKALIESATSERWLAQARKSHVRCNIQGSGTTSKTAIVCARQEEAKQIIRSWRTGLKRDVSELFLRKLKPGTDLIEARGDLMALLWALNVRSGERIDIIAVAPLNVWDMPDVVKEAIECLVEKPNIRRVVRKVAGIRVRCLITSREKSLESFDLDRRETVLL